MEAILLLVLIAYVLFKFNRPLTTAVKVVDKSANILDDTIDTYSNDVHILNARKRGEQLETLEELGEVVTNKQITTLLKGNYEEEVTPKKVQASS